MNQAQVFHKYTALGNDYIVLDQKDLKSNLTGHRVQKMCDRHLGIGGDGVLLVHKESKNHFNLKIYNSDGSQAGKSGNGMRIAAHYLSQKYNPDSSFYLQIKNKSFKVQKWILQKNNFKALIQMGASQSIIIPQNINLPFKYKNDRLFLKIKSRLYPVVLQEIGNPHLSIIDEEKILNKTELISLGKDIQKWKVFQKSKGINVQLVHPINKRKIQIYIYERGSGYTLASGSSSCASALATQKLFPLTKFPLQVKNELGEFKVLLKEEQIYLEGKSCHLFQGSYH